MEQKSWPWLWQEAASDLVAEEKIRRVVVAEFSFQSGLASGEPGHILKESNDMRKNAKHFLRAGKLCFPRVPVRDVPLSLHTVLTEWARKNGANQLVLTNHSTTTFSQTENLINKDIINPNNNGKEKINTCALRA